MDFPWFGTVARGARSFFLLYVGKARAKSCGKILFSTLVLFHHELLFTLSSLDGRNPHLVQIYSKPSSLSLPQVETSLSKCEGGPLISYLTPKIIINTCSYNREGDTTHRTNARPETQQTTTSNNIIQAQPPPRPWPSWLSVLPSCCLIWSEIYCPQC